MTHGTRPIADRQFVHAGLDDDAAVTIDEGGSRPRTGNRPLNLMEGPGRDWAKSVEKDEPTRKPGRPEKYSDKEVLRVAECFCRLGGRDAVKATARTLEMGRNEVGGMIAIARARGFLTKPGKGAVDGALTMLGESRLRDAEDKED